MTITIRPGMRLSPGVSVSVPAVFVPPPVPTYGMEFRTFSTATSTAGDTTSTCNEGDFIYFDLYGTNIPDAPDGYIQVSGPGINSLDVDSGAFPAFVPSGGDDAPFIITTTGADWPPANKTYTRAVGTIPPTWTNPSDHDTKITYNNSIWAVRNEAAFGNKNVYINTGTFISPLSQWSLDPASGLGSVPPTGTYTYRFNPLPLNPAQEYGNSTIPPGPYGAPIGINADQLTEGNEILTVSWYINTTTLVTSTSITIVDTSKGIVTGGLLYNYDASTYSGSGDWIDSVSGAHAVRGGFASQYPTYDGTAFTLDRSLNQHFIAPWPQFRTVYTIDVWFVMDGNQNGEASLICDSFSGPMNFVICSPNNGNHLQCGWFSTNWAYGQDSYSAGYNNNGTTWYNLTMSVSSTGVVDYVNGAVSNATQNPFAGISSPNGTGSAHEFWIGKGWSGGYFNGKVAVVNMYDRALTDAEVLQNYNHYKTRYGL
jgi:hypothetical protein